MAYLADIFLAFAAIAAGVYCFVLGRRLNRFNTLEKGVGGAVAVLSAQVDDLEKTLTQAQQTAVQSANSLEQLTKRAEQVCRQLELQMASLHDVPVAQEEPPAKPTPPAEPISAKTGQPMFVRHTTNEDAA